MINQISTARDRVDSLQDEQRQRWLQGDPIRAEDYLAQHPELFADQTCTIQLLYSEIMLREEFGEQPLLEEYVRRFPHLSEQLPLLFNVHQALESQQLLDSIALASLGPISSKIATAPTEIFQVSDASSKNRRTAIWPKVDGYEILGELGRGGMGIVYKARQTGLNRIVALKMIMVGSNADNAQLIRFHGEAEVLARLEHPNIVKIYQVGEQDGRPFFSLEFVEGGSLAQQLNGTPQPARHVATFLEKLARATHAAHEQGIIHRDLKPANILLKQESSTTQIDLQSAYPKISDFGLAKNLHMDVGQTGSGAVLGTPSYMAPEQAEGRGQEIGPATDVFALGTILYELLSGAPPYKGETQLATMRLLLTEDPVPLSRFNLPTDLVTICFKCLNKDPRHRYISALELAEDLKRFLDDQPIQARRASRAELAWRWTRRNPWPATVVLLSLIVALVASISGIWLQDALEESEKHRIQIERANTDAKAKLWASYVDQAKALRSSRKPGQRVNGLKAIQEALRLEIPPDRSLNELRTEAIACLLLPDFEVSKEWDGWPEGSGGIALDGSFERYARGDKQGNVSIRRTADDKELFQLPSNGILADWELTLSKDGLYLLQSGNNRKSRIWKLEGIKPVIVFEENASLLLRPDGRQFAAYQPNGIVRLHETETGKEIRRFKFETALDKWCWNPNNTKLAIITNGVCITLDLETGEKKQVPIPRIWSFAWHPNGRILAVITDKRILFWDTAKNSLHLPPILGHKMDGIKICFDPTGDHLYSSDWWCLWRLWDTRSGKQLLTMPVNSNVFAFQSDRRLVGIETFSPKLRLFRAYPGNEFRSLSFQIGGRASEFITTTAISVDGRLLAVQVSEGIALVDVANFEILTHMQMPGSKPLQFSKDEKALLTYGPQGIQYWPIQAEAKAEVTRLGPPTLLHAHTGTDTIGISDDGMSIAIPKFQLGSSLWDRNRNQSISLNPQEDVRNCAVSPNGRWVASGSHDYRQGPCAKIWDATLGKHVADLPVGTFCSVRFSPDGKWLVTTGGGIRIWHVGSWTEGPPLGTLGVGSGFAFSPDSQYLAIGDHHGFVRLVVTESGKEIACLTSPEPTRLAPLCFTPDGTRLITLGTESSDLHIFDLRSIRRQLLELGLDWNQPPFSPANLTSPLPRQFEIVTGSSVPKRNNSRTLP